MNTLLQLAAILATATLSSTNVVNKRSNDNFELLILHNNDMHARFEQTSQLSGTCTPADRDAGRCYGGFARVAHVVKEARRAAASGEGPPVLYLNAGDTYTGTAWFTIYKWKIAAEFINALQPDAVSLGNHEFDHGVSGVIPFIKNLSCPVLAANLDLTKVPELVKQTNLKKSVVFNISGTEVGIIGYLTPETKTIAIKNDVEYIDEIEALQSEVTDLEQQGVKIIIALGHSGYTKDQQIAREVKGIDLVIGGHSHSFLWNGTIPDSEFSEGPYPTYVTQASGRRVPVVQAYAFTKYFGRLRLLFDANGEIIASDGTPIILDKTVPEDPDTLAVLERYRKAVQNISNEVIGTTSVILDSRSCEKEECILGNLITDSIIYHYAALYRGEYWTDAPIALMQAGGIRSSVAHSKLPAQVTKGDLLTVMPFKGSLVTVAMNGSVLLQVLEHSIVKYQEPRVGEFLQMSGLKVVYDYRNPVGSRVVKAVARCWACTVPKYSDVEVKQIYNVIMPDFVSNGGDGYSMLKDLKSQTLPFNELLSTEYYLRQHSPVFPELDGRITIIKDELHKDSSHTIYPSLPVIMLSTISLIYRLI